MELYVRSIKLNFFTIRDDRLLKRWKRDMFQLWKSMRGCFSLMMTCTYITSTWLMRILERIFEPVGIEFISNVLITIKSSIRVTDTTFFMEKMMIFMSSNVLSVNSLLIVYCLLKLKSSQIKAQRLS